MGILLNSATSLFFGLAVAGVWHLRCRHRGWPSRRQDYVWAFIEGGVAYVMVALLIGRYYFDISYATTLTYGFGETQINVAFLGALYESVHGLFDLWNGDGISPSLHF
jgi:hypothetical protein